MPQPIRDLSGLDAAIHLKSKLLRALVTSAPSEWPQHISSFIDAMDASHLQDITALLVLLAELHEEVRLLTRARSLRQDRAGDWLPRGCDGELSKHELLTGFRDELLAAADSLPTVGDGASPLIKAMSDYIEMHYAKPVTLALLASVLQRSKRHLATLFRKQTGRTIHGYLTQVRIRHAAALILEGEKIEAVSLIVGYRSKKNFYRHFKEAVGLTPLQFKRAHAVRQAR